jgi:hypothetical protein
MCQVARISRSLLAHGLQLIPGTRGSHGGRDAPCGRGRPRYGRRGRLRYSWPALLFACATLGPRYSSPALPLARVTLRPRYSSRALLFACATVPCELPAPRFACAASGSRAVLSSTARRARKTLSARGRRSPSYSRAAHPAPKAWRMRREKYLDGRPSFQERSSLARLKDCSAARL